MNNCNYQNLCIDQTVRVMRLQRKCVLSMSNCDKPYGVPMYYTFCCNGTNITLRMLTQCRGKKINYINNNDNVSILIEKQCWGSTYSVIIEGKAIVEQNDCPTGNCDECIIKVCVENISGRKYCN